eukprot:1149766-Pelagomonas_calceolata.AAC.15
MKVSIKEYQLTLATLKPIFVYRNLMLALLASLDKTISADTGIPNAGPARYRSSQIFWLAKEEEEGHAVGTFTAHGPASKPT